MNHPLMVILLLLAAAVLGVWVIYAFDGTGDSGDSIVHYQFARFAYKHPMNFLDSWAKPVFVLLTAPFAQFGFVGMKSFNLLLSVMTSFLLFRVLRKMGASMAWMTIPFLFAAPLFFTLIFSGLTEYLFAFFLVLALYLSMNRRFWVAGLLISFLPFVRSEGLLILPVFMLYFVLRRQGYALLWLLTGHLVYALAGAIFKGDPFWMFTQNAYVAFSNEYGSGDLWHFFRQMPYVIGVPLAVLLVASMVLFAVLLFRKDFRCRPFFTERVVLVALPFLVYFAAHVVFWKFGLFHSMGLKRVLIAVVPLMILPVVEGLSMLYDWMSRKHIRWAGLILMLLFHAVVVFPFTSGPAAINPERELAREPLQREALAVCNQLKEKVVLGSFSRIYCSAQNIEFFLDMDPFDKERCLKVKEYQRGSGKSLVIWDCCAAQCEDGVAVETLLANENLEVLFKSPGVSQQYCYYVFTEK